MGPTIADYEFCQNVTTLICQQLSTTREGQQRQLAPDQYSDAVDSSDYDLKDYNYNNKDSLDYKAKTRASPVDVCVTKVSKMCYPSQRIEKSTVQKEFCWEQDIVSCQDEVAQMVDTVICDVEELPEPQVRATTEEPEATTLNTDQMGRIMVVGNMTTLADNQETTTPSAPVASFKNSTEYPSTTTTTTESATTASEYNMVRIVVETTPKPETTEDPEAEPESESESEPTSSTEVKADPGAEPKAVDDSDNQASDDSDNKLKPKAGEEDNYNKEQATTTTKSNDKMKARVTTIKPDGAVTTMISDTYSSINEEKTTTETAKKAETRLTTSSPMENDDGEDNDGEEDDDDEDDDHDHDHDHDDDHDHDHEHDHDNKEIIG